jgi:hypothetical protein
MVIGVRPKILPLESAITTLCGSGDLLVKSMAILPAVAVSEDWSYFSRPLGFAASARTAAWLLLELEELAGAVAAGVLVEVAPADQDELDELEPPQPATTSASNTTVGMSRRAFMFCLGPRFRLRSTPSAA